MEKLRLNFTKTAKILLFAMLVIPFFSTCKDKDNPPEPEKSSAKEITNFKITAIGGEKFDAVLQSDGKTFLFTVPFGFDSELLTRATGDFTLSPGAKSVPASGQSLDFNEDVTYTVTAEDESTAIYTVHKSVGVSTETKITEFTIALSIGEEFEGIIDNASSKISISVPVYLWNFLEDAVPKFAVSQGATVHPASEMPQDFREPVQYVVTANDGTTKQTWTVEVEAVHVDYDGIRPYSAKLMFAKQLKSDLGITADHLTGGIAVTDDYVIINTRNENSIYIDTKTGEKVGEIDLGAIKGSYTNFYTTADKAGNVLICNLAQNDGTFKVWRLTSLTGDTELYIDWPENESDNIGRKISVYGNLNENAIITAPLLTVGGGTTLQRFARWTVIDGILTSQTPDEITMSGLTNGWNANCDIVHTSDTDLNSDYFVASYSDNTFAWVNGATNQVHKKLDAISTNYIPNAVDYIEFNNAKYVTLNWVNSFDWGSADIVWLLDVSTDAKFSGNLETKTCDAVVWECAPNTYGAKAVEPLVVNTNGTGDVALSKSADGKYLYLYFMFTNGYVVGYQFDCIDPL